MNKKILAIIIILSVMILSFVALFFLFNNNDRSTDPSLNNAPAPIDYPAPSNSEQNIQEETYEYTNDIVSPNTLATNPNEYINKTISTRGRITKIGENQYLILSINNNELYGPQLETKLDIDFGTYTDNLDDPTKQGQAVTLSGELILSETTNSLVFLVYDIVE